MIAHSLRVREVRFAYLFGPPRFIERDEASRVHGKICDALRVDDLSLKYSTADAAGDPNARAFTVALERREGSRGALQFAITGAAGEEPLRMVLVFTWPPSLEHVKDTFDVAAAAAFDVLRGKWTRVIAETRLIVDCAPTSSDGLGFITDRLLGSTGGWLESVGKPLTQASVKFEIGMVASDKALENPRRELSIEVLLQDETRLYVELMCQWAQLPPGAPLDLSKIRKIDARPSEYTVEAYNYLVARLNGLAPEAR